MAGSQAVAPQHTDHLLHPVPYVSEQEVIVSHETESLEDMARRIADEYGVEYRILDNLVSSESRWDPEAVGPTGDYGLVQINLAANPDITKEQAFDPEFSLRFAAEKIAAGEHVWRWTVCNCYITLKARGYDLPATPAIAPNTAPVVGAIAIFDYDGVSHYAEVTELNEGSFQVFEGNYEACKTGYRTISWEDENIKGFYMP